MRSLRGKGIECSGSGDKTLLCRLGYFNLVNGYKTPFVAAEDSGSGKKSYYPKTTLQNIKRVYDFDESLRMLLFPCLTKVENEIRTFAAYKFDEVNSVEGLTWFDVKAYDPNQKPSEIVNVISKAYAEVNYSKKLNYVHFYLDNHDSIPTWIFAKVIKFETLINFIKKCKTDVKDALCNLYDIKDKNGVPSHNLLINMLFWIKHIRNVCAHNGRIYTQIKEDSRLSEKYIHGLPRSYTKDRDQRIIDLLAYLKYFLDPESFCSLIDRFSELLMALQNDINPDAFNKVRISLGVKNIADLQLFKKEENRKNYNSF